MQQLHISKTVRKICIIAACASSRLKVDQHRQTCELRLAPHHVLHDTSTNVTVVCESVRLCVRPESVTGNYLTRVKKVAFFAPLRFDISEAVD